MINQRFRVWNGHQMDHPEEDYHHHHIGPNGNLRVELVLSADPLSGVESVSNTSLIGLSEPLNDHVAMQYTGMRDENKNPIYACDIVKGIHPETNKGHIGTVTYYQPQAQFVFECPSFIEPLYQMHELEVLGNKFEDSEILDKAYDK